jgi:NAD(P)-dependent dehydrogenase (short-subunit alcohol dehydrogenase family)
MFSEAQQFPRETAALVTGAGSGIGAATVRALHARGVRGFVLIDRDERSMEALSESLTEAQFLHCAHDVADEASWVDTVRRLRSSIGRLDLLVANAGVADAAPLTEMSFELWRRVLSVNLDGVFLTLKHGLSLMKAGQRGGACVVVASAAAVRAEPGVGAYGAAKECAADRIRVNAILPGGVATPIWRNVPFFKDLVRDLGSEQAALDAMGKGMPLGRYATADEIASQIVFLLSDAAGPMTGASVLVDSGYTL